jgi:lipopolysaccharide export system permease protein
LGQTVIRAARIETDGTSLGDVSFHLFGADGSLQGRIEADTATLEPGQWRLSGAKRWDLATDNPEMAAETVMVPLTLPTDLTTEKLIEYLGSPATVGFWDMPSEAQALEKAGFSAISYRLGYQMELALPLLLAAMVLVAAGFTMRHARFGKSGQMVLYALMGGFFIFFLRNFAQVLGENGQIPILVAAWSPPVAAALLAVSLLLHLEDG